MEPQNEGGALMSSTPIEADPMNDSILDTVKKLQGVVKEYDAFDVDILVFINSVLSNLSQLGIGPANGFVVTGSDETWGDLLGENKKLNNVKLYMTLKVKLAFDPPTTAHAIAAIEKIIAEQEVRISIERETTDWVDPTLSDFPARDDIVDGGIVG
jgi:hypothetical protein